MATIYWQADESDNWKVYARPATPEEEAELGGADGIHGGPKDNRGPVVPVTAEHAALLKQQAKDSATP